MSTAVRQRSIARRLLAVVVVGAIGFARHAYLTGYIAGRQDLWNELDRMDRRYRRTRS